MVDAIKKLFSQPIEIEICIGMAIALLVWIRAGIKALAKKSAAAARRVKLKDEIASLQKHLHTQMEINNKGNQALRQTLASLQETSQRLTQAVSVLKDKPGRAEIRTLHLYTKALSIMSCFRSLNTKPRVRANTKKTNFLTHLAPKTTRVHPDSNHCFAGSVDSLRLRASRSASRRQGYHQETNASNN
jgi:hypothetical protein